MLYAEVRLQTDAVRDHHDDERAKDGVAWLPTTTEQRRAADDGRSYRKQQDVAGAEIELGAACVRRQKHTAERGEAGVHRERRDLDVPDVDARTPGGFLVA